MIEWTVLLYANVAYFSISSHWSLLFVVNAPKYALRIRCVRSTRFACGWYAVENFFLMAHKCVSSLMICDVKFVALSDMRRDGKLYLQSIFSRMQLAAVSALQFGVGTAIKNFVRSQMAVKMYLLPRSV